MKINHPSLREPEQAKPTDEFCPNSSDGEHNWVTGIACNPGSGESVPIVVCVACGRFQ